MGRLIKPWNSTVVQAKLECWISIGCWKVRLWQMRGVEAWMLVHWGTHHLGGVIGRWLRLGRALGCWIPIGPALIRGHWGGWAGRWILIGWAAAPSSPPSPGLLGMWRGERSSWRCTNNGGCRGITKVHRGITKVHSGTARCRRRGVVNPIHAAS